jgi:hypothetical protein
MTKATIGHSKGDFDYITRPGGAIADRQGNVVGSYRSVDTPMRDPRLNERGTYDNWSTSKIQGRLSDGSTFTGKLSYLPGTIGNTDVGSITIKPARSPRAKGSAFKKNADLMVWKNAEYSFIVLARAYSGWHLFKGRPQFSSRIPGTPFEKSAHIYAFTPSPGWERVAISMLPKADVDFFKAYVAAAHKSF